MHSARLLLPRILSRRLSCSPSIRDGIINHDKVYVYWNNKLCLTPTEAKLSPLEFLNLSDLQRRERAIFIPYFTDGSILKVMWTDKASPSGLCEFTGVCIYQSEDMLNVATTFILRNVIKEEGVNITFEKHSPIIQSIDLIRFQKIEWNEEGESLEDYPLSASKIPDNLTTLLTNKPLPLTPSKSGPVVSNQILNKLIKKKEIHIIKSAKEIKEEYDPYYKWYITSQDVPSEIIHDGIRDIKEVSDRHIDILIGDTK
ncbi:39S ribosomal protein L19, mitochondrial-like [Oopsacas minuta]|uniref:Large ribosomal subunit protein bL19m n=1 Tax=Oopsacas minuta TaxID=111878 RepID=A0AAV7JVE1_9METZ|nr:39S ribosomal protein L19, mitochondrial-like [Oopsacas minuta]